MTQNPLPATLRACFLSLLLILTVISATWLSEIERMGSLYPVYALAEAEETDQTAGENREGPEDLYREIYALQSCSPDDFLKRIEAMSDAEYEAYYRMHSQLQEEERRAGGTMTAFALCSGQIFSGQALKLQEKDGEILLPDLLMFLICPAAGEDYYIYADDPSLSVLFRNGAAEFSYTDSFGKKFRETLYTGDVSAAQDVPVMETEAKIRTDCCSRYEK